MHEILSALAVYFISASQYSQHVSALLRPGDLTPPKQPAHP